MKESNDLVEKTETFDDVPGVYPVRMNTVLFWLLVTILTVWILTIFILSIKYFVTEKAKRRSALAH